MSWNPSKILKVGPALCALVVCGGALGGCATTPANPPVSAEIPPAPPPPAPPPPPRPAAAMKVRPPTPMMVVIRGSDEALRWYPKGREVRVGAKICLPATSRYITFQRLDGGTVTYGGGGCNQVITEPPRDSKNSAGTSGGQ